MTASVFSVANMKGGVGKTTISVALAQQFAKSAPGVRVLLVDLDAQANASFWLCGDVVLTALIEQGKTIDAFLEDSIVLGRARALEDYVHATIKPGLSVIPSSPELRIIEREIIVFLSRRKRNLLEVERVVAALLTEQLESLKAAFDVIVFDCAPGISSFTEAALRSSDVVVVPTVPDFISNLGLEAFCKSVFWAPRAGGGSQKSPWVVANMVRSTPHHQVMLQEMRAEAEAQDGGFKMFRVEIPNMPSIDEANADGGSHGAREFDAAASNMFSALAAEVIEASKVNEG